MIDENRINKLKDILTEMQSLADEYDVERAHGRADDLLLQALRVAGGYDSLIEAYENVPKWYA